MILIALLFIQPIRWLIARYRVRRAETPTQERLSTGYSTANVATPDRRDQNDWER